MIFAIYARKSVYSDKSDSVSNQIKMCREYIAIRHGENHIFQEYRDEGFTGANTNRPALEALLDDVEAERIDAVIIYQLDRLSRSVKDFSNIYAMLEEHHIMFISVKENVDTDTPIGRAMTMITMVFAQMERETIAARVTDNLEGLARRGFWTGGKAPLGYSLNRVEVDGKKHVTLSIVPEESEYCLWLFDTFLTNNYSLQGMQTAFRNQGIKTANGGFLSASRLYKILSTPYGAEATPEVNDYFSRKGCRMDPDSPREKWDGTYGVMIYGRSSEKTRRHVVQPPDQWIVCIGCHKPFIPAEKWLEVQERFRQNTFDKTMKYDVPLLKGVVRCAKCGCKMAVARKKLKSNILSHYYCRKRNQEGVEACDMKYVKCSFLDNKMLEIFRHIEADPESIMQYVHESSHEEQPEWRDFDSEIAPYKAKIARLTSFLSEVEESSAAKHMLHRLRNWTQI